MVDKVEVWANVPGYEDLYSVSHLGRVYSKKNDKILKPHIANGYLKVNLYKNYSPSKHFIHTLVLTAFTDPRPPGMVCNHVNGKKDDCEIWNLEWATSQENTRRAVATGAMKRKLNEEQRQDIRKLYAGGSSQTLLADMYGVSIRTIGDIVHSKRKINHADF